MAMNTALRRMLIQVPTLRNWSDCVAPKATKAIMTTTSANCGLNTRRESQDPALVVERSTSPSHRAGGAHRAGSASPFGRAVGFDRAGDQPDDLPPVGGFPAAQALHPAEAHDLDLVGDVEDHFEIVADQDHGLAGIA